MLRMIGVKIQRRAIRIFRDEPCIKRTLEMKDVRTNFEALDIRYDARQYAQFRDVVFALLGRGFGFVFPTDDMD